MEFQNFNTFFYNIFFQHLNTLILRLRNSFEKNKCQKRLNHKQQTAPEPS
jgi:hypothetical protein